MKKIAFVEETEFVMNTGWPSVQAELKKIVEVELHEDSQYVPAEFAAETEYFSNARNPNWTMTWGRNETSYKAVGPDGRIRYFSYREI